MKTVKIVAALVVMLHLTFSAIIVMTLSLDISNPEAISGGVIAAYVIGFPGTDALFLTDVCGESLLGVIYLLGAGALQWIAVLILVWRGQ